MNSLNRPLIAELSIGLVVCFAFAHTVLSPARKQLLLARANERSGTASAVAPAGEPPRRASLLEQENDHRQSTIEKRSLPARDEAALFGAIVALAEAQNLRVDQFQPSELRTPDPIAPGETVESGAPAPNRPKDVTIAYSISLSGSYPGVVRFLDTLRRAPIFCSTKSIRIIPSESTEIAGIRTEVVSDFFAFATFDNVHEAQAAP